MKVQQVSPGIINKIKSLIARVGYLKSDIGIVEDTDTATHTISSGQYVIWKNELYKASTAIPSGDPLSSTNLTAVSDGIANELNSKFTKSSISFTAGTGVSIATQNNVWFEALGILFASIFIQVTTAVARNATVVSLPSGKTFAGRTDMIMPDGTVVTAITGTGNIIATTQALPVGTYILTAVLYV